MKCVCCLPDSIEIPFEQKWEKGEDGKLIQHSVVHIKVVAALHSIALFFYFFCYFNKTDSRSMTTGRNDESRLSAEAFARHSTPSLTNALKLNFT